MVIKKCTLNSDIYFILYLILYLDRVELFRTLSYPVLDRVELFRTLSYPVL